MNFKLSSKNNICAILHSKEHHFNAWEASVWTNIQYEQKRWDVVSICQTQFSRWQLLIDDAYPSYFALRPPSATLGSFLTAILKAQMSETSQSHLQPNQIFLHFWAQRCLHKQPGKIHLSDRIISKAWIPNWAPGCTSEPLTHTAAAPRNYISPRHQPESRRNSTSR